MYSCPRESPLQTTADASNLIIQPDTCQVIRSLPGNRPPKILSDGLFTHHIWYTYSIIRYIREWRTLNDLVTWRRVFCRDKSENH